MSSKTVMNAMQWPRKWTLEKERKEKKKQSYVCGRVLSLYSPSPQPFPTQAGVCFYICVSVCAPAIMCVSEGMCV